MKKIAALILSLAVAAACSGCGSLVSLARLAKTSSTPSSGPEYGEESEAYGEDEEEPEEEESSPEEQAYTPGEWQGDTFVSELDELRFTLPDGWVSATQEELLQLMSIAVDSDVIKDKAKLAFELSKLSTVYEMMATHMASGDNVILMNENLKVSSPLRSVTVEEYAGIIRDNMAGMTDMQRTFGDVYEQDVAGQTYLVLPAVMDGTSLAQNYYMRKVGSRMAVLCLTYHTDGSGVTPEDVLAAFSDPSLPAPERMGDETDAQETQRVGNDTLGYVSVPSDWVPFRDVEGGDDFQYSDLTGNSIITMNLFDLTGLTAEQIEQFDVDLAAQGLWLNIQNNGGKEIKGAQVTLSGYDARQIYAGFDDGDILVTWVFDTGDGSIHYLAAEGTSDTVMDVVRMVEQTYSMTK